jgi:small subunit ribosomal protein S14
MSTTAKGAKFKKQLARVEQHKRELAKPRAAHKLMKPREMIRIRLRCRLCGRPRAVYRKFGVCRICFRNLANDGLIPGVHKASW